MTLPYTITAGNDAEAAPVQGNFNNLDIRLASVEGQIEDLAVSVDTYSNGVFSGGLTASQVAKTLVYTTGGMIVNHTYYYKSTLIVDFEGEAANTYYVEADSTGEVDIYTSKSAARTNLNTVVWNGTSFDSVTDADRTVLYGDDNFAVLNGRAGGQTLYGDTAASGNLILESTYHSTKGTVQVRNACIQHKLTTQTAATLNATAANSLIVCNTSSNAITINLPDASTVLGQEMTIYVQTVNSANAVTVVCASGDTLNLAGNNRITLTEEDSVTLVAISANRWFVKINTNAVLSTV